MPKLVQKTCMNPECGFKDEMLEDVRFCPECDWGVKPWEPRVVESAKMVEGVRKQVKKKRAQRLMCPQCGYEYAGRWSAYFAKVEKIEAKREERLRRLRKGVNKDER